MQNGWEITTSRFVAFLDILGFKDLVQRNSHTEVLQKLEKLTKIVSNLADLETIANMKNFGVAPDQTKSFTFSDSIIFFSKGNSFNDALKLVFDSYTIMRKALNDGIAIKGAISYGQITVDFEKSLFFGQPIIDAFLLHEDLQMLTMIFDHNSEVMIRSLDDRGVISRVMVKYKAVLKSGKITHTLLRPLKGDLTTERITSLEKLYDTTCGRPRYYIDSSLDFINSLLKE